MACPNSRLRQGSGVPKEFGNEAVGNPGSRIPNLESPAITSKSKSGTNITFAASRV